MTSFQNFIRIGAVVTTVSCFALSSVDSNAAAGDTERVNVPDPSTGQAEANGGSVSTVKISGDGRYVIFHSTATNLTTDTVPNWANSIFLRDRQSGTTELVTLKIDGSPFNSSIYDFDMSPDARFVVWEAAVFKFGDPNCELFGNYGGRGSLFLRDRDGGTSECVNLNSDGEVANDRSGGPAISADGIVVAFVSDATNLVDGDTNGVRDVFVKFLNTGEVRRVNVSSSGMEANALSWQVDISDDGRYVVFDSLADNLVADDTNGHPDVFLHDLNDGATRRLGHVSNGDEPDRGAVFPLISGDGRIVSFVSDSRNIWAESGTGRLYVHDVASGANEAVHVNSLGEPGNGFGPRVHGLSSDGSKVVFQSGSSNLAENDPDGMNYFLRDREAGTTQMVDVNSLGERAVPAPTYTIGSSAVSSNGRFTAFNSPGANLVPDDLNGVWDVFVHQVEPLTPVEMLEEIIDLIVDLNLDNGISNSLDAKLDSALGALSDMNENNDAAACNSLSALINAINAQSGNQIDPGEAEDLIGAAEATMSQIGCE